MYHIHIFTTATINTHILFFCNKLSKLSGLKKTYIYYLIVLRSEPKMSFIWSKTNVSVRLCCLWKLKGEICLLVCSSCPCFLYFPSSKSVTVSLLSHITSLWNSLLLSHTSIFFFFKNFFDCIRPTG